MTVRIVTDSTADLPPGVAEELGISIVPLYVRFGEEVYRDRVDISEDEFYQRLTHDPVHPGTTQPTPQDFADVYRELSKDAEGIVSIHISSKLSGTYESALQGREMTDSQCPIEVVDSLWASMGLGLLVLDAVAAAKEGKSPQQIADEAREMIPRIRYLGMFDTLKYLHLGGRIGKAKCLLGSALNVKPLLTLRNGEFHAVGRARTRSKGLSRLYEFVQNAGEISDLTIVHSTTPDDVEALAERIHPIFPRDRIVVARLGPVLGVHTGPGTVFVGIRLNLCYRSQT
jgi:DegV family protein with EDD domain